MSTVQGKPGAPASLRPDSIAPETPATSTERKGLLGSRGCERSNDSPPSFLATIKSAFANLAQKIRPVRTLSVQTAPAKVQVLVGDAIGELRQLPAAQKALVQAQTNANGPTWEKSIGDREKALDVPFAQRRSLLQAKRTELEGAARSIKEALAKSEEQLEAIAAREPDLHAELNALGGKPADRKTPHGAASDGKAGASNRQGSTPNAEADPSRETRINALQSELLSLEEAGRILLNDVVTLNEEVRAVSLKLEGVERDLQKIASERRETFDKDEQLNKLKDDRAVAKLPIGDVKTTQLAALNGLAKAIRTAMPQGKASDAFMQSAIDTALIVELSKRPADEICQLAQLAQEAAGAEQSFPAPDGSRTEKTRLDAEGLRLVEMISKTLSGYADVQALTAKAADGTLSSADAVKLTKLLSNADSFMLSRKSELQLALGSKANPAVWLNALPDKVLADLHAAVGKQGMFEDMSQAGTAPAIESRTLKALNALDAAITASLAEFAADGNVPLEGMRSLPADTGFIAQGLTLLRKPNERNILKGGGSPAMQDQGKLACKAMLDTLLKDGPAAFNEQALALVPLEKAVTTRTPAASFSSAIEVWMRPALETLSAEQLGELAVRVENLKLFEKDTSAFGGFARDSLAKLIEPARQTAIAKESLEVLNKAIKEDGEVPLEGAIGAALIAADAALTALRKAGSPADSQPLAENLMTICQHINSRGLGVEGLNTQTLLDLGRILRPASGAQAPAPIRAELTRQLEQIKLDWTSHLKDAFEHAGALKGAPPDLGSALQALDRARETESVYRAVQQAASPEQPVRDEHSSVVAAALAGVDKQWATASEKRQGMAALAALAPILRGTPPTPDTGKPEAPPAPTPLDHRLARLADYLDTLSAHVDMVGPLQSPAVPSVDAASTALLSGLGIKMIDGKRVDLMGMKAHALKTVRDMFTAAAGASSGRLTEQAARDFHRQSLFVKESGTEQPQRIKADNPGEAAQVLARQLAGQDRRVWLASQFCNQQANQLVTYLITNPNSPLFGVNFTDGEREAVYTLTPGTPRDTIRVSYSVKGCNRIGTPDGIMKTDPDKTFINMAYEFSYDHSSTGDGDVRIESMPDVDFGMVVLGPDDPQPN